MNDGLKTQILAIIAEVAEKEASEIRPDHHLAGDLDIDSARAVDLLCQMEDLLQCDLLEDAEREGWETVRDLLQRAGCHDAT